MRTTISYLLIYNFIMSYTYKIVQDLEKDAWNWFEACNKVGHGVDWKQRIDPEIASNIAGKSKDGAYHFLIPYLADKWQNDLSVSKGADYISRRFEKCFSEACEKLVDISGHPLYRNDFTIYLTTFPRGPYNFDQGALWVCAMWFNPIANFMHEVLHFQFIHYWRNDSSSEVSKLSDESFEILKESLTVVLDSSLMPLIEKADKGYDIHQELREKLHIHWLNNRDFNSLITYSLTLLP